MKNCHNCFYMTDEKIYIFGDLCYRCKGVVKYVSESVLGEECKYWQKKTKKEAVEVELKAQDKEYTTGQVVDLLLENPKRKAIMCTFESELEVENGDFKINGHTFTIHSHHANAKWQIIEPQPKEVELWEAVIAYAELISVESIVSGRKYIKGSNTIFEATEEELKGKWQILN